MDAVRTSETYFNETTRCYVPKGCHCTSRRREILKSLSCDLFQGHISDVLANIARVLTDIQTG